MKDVIGNKLVVSVFIVLVFVGLNACDKDDSELGTNWNEGVVHFTGEPALDGCGWMLFSEGVDYSLYQMPDKYLVNGMNVWFRGKELREYYGCGLAQNSYKIYEIQEVVEKPWTVRSLDDYPDHDLSMDAFSIDTAFVEGDSLRLHVGYSGGCAIHQFNMWAIENADDEVHLMLEHIGNGDMCEAYPHEWLAFCLLPLQEDDKNEITFMMRGSPIMSSLYGPYTYTY